MSRYAYGLGEGIPGLIALAVAVPQLGADDLLFLAIAAGAAIVFGFVRMMRTRAAEVDRRNLLQLLAVVIGSLVLLGFLFGAFGLGLLGVIFAIGGLQELVIRRRSLAT